MSKNLRLKAARAERDMTQQALAEAPGSRGRRKAWLSARRYDAEGSGGIRRRIAPDHQRH